MYKDGSLPVLFLCAVKFQRCPPSLLQHITNIGRHLSTDESTASQLEPLSFVPMSYLRGAVLFMLLRFPEVLHIANNSWRRVTALVNFSKNSIITE